MNSKSCMHLRTLGGSIFHLWSVFEQGYWASPEEHTRGKVWSWWVVYTPRKTVPAISARSVRDLQRFTFEEAKVSPFQFFTDSGYPSPAGGGGVINIPAPDDIKNEKGDGDFGDLLTGALFAVKCVGRSLVWFHKWQKNLLWRQLIMVLTSWSSPIADMRSSGVWTSKRSVLHRTHVLRCFCYWLCD